jgi:hypothetical protein
LYENKQVRAWAGAGAIPMKAYEPVKIMQLRKRLLNQISQEDTPGIAVLLTLF